MNTNTKIVLVVVALVATGGIGYAILATTPPTNTNPEGNATTTNTSAPDSSPLALQGTVTGVDAGMMQITLNASTTNPLKVVTISQATKIEKIISQKDASGKVEKQALVEVNIEDVQKGNLVTVFYQFEKDGVLSGVSRATFVVEWNIDAYFQSQSANQTPYLKGQVVSIDIAGKMLKYNPVIFDTISTTTVSVAIPDGISVYRVDDPLRVSIIHARTVANLTDIQTGQTIFIMADAAPLKAWKIVPEALIISGK